MTLNVPFPTNPGDPITGQLSTQAGFIVSPFDNPQAWDYINVSGYQWVGKIVVRRAKRAYKWDKKNPKGQDGETQTYSGRNYPAFTLSFHFWDTAGWNAWQQFSRRVFIFDATKPPLGTPTGIGVYHPALQAVSISAILVDDVGAPELQNEGGEYVAVVTAREFRPVDATNTTSTPKGATTATRESGGTFTRDPPLDPAEALAQSALQQEIAAGDNGNPVQGPGGLP